MSKFDPDLVVPIEVVNAVRLVTSFGARHNPPGGQWQIGGLGPVFDLQRQLAEVTRERDLYKNMTELHDALNDRRRAIADNERRTIRGR